MTLIQAIDDAVNFVKAYPEQMTREKLEMFDQLAEAVFSEALRAGLVDALPKVPEMLPQLESQVPPLPPVQFETRLNLPGDWTAMLPLDDDDLPPVQPLIDNGDGDGTEQVAEQVFLVCASPRWFHDLASLRSLAESKTTEVGGMLSMSDLAKKHRVDYDKLRKRLDTWRLENDSGYVEVTSRKPRDPKFLFDESSVMPVIDALKSGGEPAAKNK